MSANGDAILVVHDVEETRDGIEKLLLADGFQVTCARKQADAVVKIELESPDLILVNLFGPAIDMIACARRIREHARLGVAVPLVIFCVDAVQEGEEIDFGDNIYVTRPDNFDQLLAFLHRLLRKSTQ